MLKSCVSEASSNKKGKRRYPKIKNKCIWQASSSTGKREGQEFQRLQRGLHVLQRNSGPKLLIHSFKTKRVSQRFSKIYHSKLFVKLLRNVTTICTPSANLFWLNKPLKKLGNTKETTKGSSYFFFFSKHFANTVLLYVRVCTRCKKWLLEKVKQGKKWKKEDNKAPFCCSSCGDVPLCRQTDLATSCWAKWHKQIHGFSQKLGWLQNFSMLAQT